MISLNEKKYAIVTGCGSGIGKEIANRLCKKGIYVFGFDIEKADENFRSFVCDVSDENQVKNILEKISKQTSYINYLVNAAGMLTIGQPLAIKDMSIKQWDAIMRVNLRSVVIMIKHTYPYMKDIHDSSIVNISSEQVYNPDKCFSPYAASKAGINMLTVSAAKEFLSDGIRVNAVALGTVKTNILKSLPIDSKQEDSMYESKDNTIPFGIIELQSVYNVVNFLLSKESKYITGEIIRCDGGMFLGK